MSIGSTFEGGSRGRRRKVVTCGCGDVCSLAVARTKDNYQVEGGDCGFFKWYEEEEDGKVYISQYNVEWFKGKIDINIDNGIHYIYHNVKLYENNWINGAPSGCKS
ncbi:hypothetical protein LXL04_038810 [Taraxacum kok-saghyz]